MSSGVAKGVVFQRGSDGGDWDPPEPPDSGPPEPSLEHLVELRGITTKHASPSRTLLKPALALLGRLGGKIKFDESHLRPHGPHGELTDLGAALVCYAALLTWLFDDPRMYGYGKLRHLGRTLAEQMGVSPLRYRLQLAMDGEDAIPRVQLGPIELGSAKFLQTVAIITTIIGGLGSGIGGIVSAAADGPQAWHAAQDYYLPAIAKFLDAVGETGGEAVELTAEFLGDYFSRLETVLKVSVTPKAPEPATRERSGSYPIRSKTRSRTGGS